MPGLGYADLARSSRLGRLRTDAYALKRRAGTFQTASSAMSGVIFDSPSRRSRNTIGTSVDAEPRRTAR